TAQTSPSLRAPTMRAIASKSPVRVVMQSGAPDSEEEVRQIETVRVALERPHDEARLAAVGRRRLHHEIECLQTGIERLLGIRQHHDARPKAPSLVLRHHDGDLAGVELDERAGRIDAEAA